jgi:hypothetical protein
MTNEMKTKETHGPFKKGSEDVPRRPPGRAEDVPPRPPSKEPTHGEPAKKSK